MTRTAPITMHGGSLHMVDSQVSIIMHTPLYTIMTTDLHTRRAPAMHISVPTMDGGRTTIALREDEYRSMLKLARGSSTDCYARVTEACRDAAEALIKSGYEGAWSEAVRRRALAILRGSYVPDRAARYDRAHAARTS